MPLGDQARTLLTSALRDPLVVTRYRTKMVQVPGSECPWWRGAVSGRGHGRKRAELHRLKHSPWWHSGQAGPMTTHRRPFGSRRAGSPWLFPGAYQGAGYLSASLSEQLGLGDSSWPRRRVVRPSRRTARRSSGRTTRHLSRHRRPVGRARQTRLDRLHRRTGRTPLGTRADVTDTDGRSSLRRVVVGTNHPQLGAPVTAPSPGTFAGGCYGNLHRKFGCHLRRGPTSPPKVRHRDNPLLATPARFVRSGLAQRTRVRPPLDSRQGPNPAPATSRGGVRRPGLGRHPPPAGGRRRSHPGRRRHQSPPGRSVLDGDRSPTRRVTSRRTATLHPRVHP